MNYDNNKLNYAKEKNNIRDNEIKLTFYTKKYFNLMIKGYIMKYMEFHKKWNFCKIYQKIHIHIMI